MFGLSTEEATLLIAASSLFLNVALVIRYLRRARNASEQIVQLEDEAETFRRDFMYSNNRLDEVDPVRFLERFEKLETAGDFESLRQAAQKFYSEHNYAIAEATRALAEAAILDFEHRGVDALDDAERFINTGRSALPDDRRLIALAEELTRRRTAVEDGDEYDFLPPQNVGAVALNKLSVKLHKEGYDALAEMLARHTIPRVLSEFGTTSPNYARAVFHHAVTLRKLKRHADAERVGRIAIEAAETAFGKDHVEYAHKLDGYATLFFVSGGSFEDYLRIKEDALLVYEEQLGTDSPKAIALRKDIDDIKNYRV